MEYFSRYINILKDEFGKNKVLYLDAGDYYNINNKNESLKIESFFNYTNLKATIIGNSEYKIDNLEKKINQSNYTILDKYSDIYKIFKLKLIDGYAIKIGVIGFSVKENKQYKLDEVISEIKKYINNAKSEGADVIILLTNLDTFCQGKDLNLKMYINVTQSCDKYSTSGKSIFNVLKHLSKEGIPDAAIVSNKYDLEIHHWEEGIPIVSSPSNGKYFNIMYLPFKKKDSKYILIKNEIKIEGPLPICEKIFKDTKICDNEIITKTNELNSFYWHNRRIFGEPINNF
jgi:2',3'-cyclic-nucleotide 2'-phosphodiesterase (5'-nucleotidase family)